MGKSLQALAAIVLLVSMSFAQSAEKKYSIFDAKGKPATFDDLMTAAASADVLFLGEFHDDSVAHAFQFEVFEAAIGRFGEKRKVTLSLEMFERDVQVVLDEYLAGHITEDHFLRSSRPWGNYKADYRPLVELAREKKLEVIAANAPRRYVNMVSRLGKESVEKLSPEAKKWLPPLPFGEPSEAYARKFNALMGRIHEPGQAPSTILYSQTLWDASMAYWISESLKQNRGSLVIHLNGGFHTESRLGTVEHLERYSPNARSVVITIRYEEDFSNFDKAKHAGLGDFVVLTDASQPRSQR
ncbi:MAG TPA: ChaN family lipoprotein [Pyrinomonadaceae bacterium]|nr:ChaN family lipoprotein [Pyrinomonadaceae bacterium]HMP66783.1 ChaN family lipoprotein [Pyrinomonadaceae bacterium]